MVQCTARSPFGVCRKLSTFQIHLSGECYSYVDLILYLSGASIINVVGVVSLNQYQRSREATDMFTCVLSIDI